MYKAIKEIGEYKVGDEVPAEQAKVWLSMYAVPHVELTSEEPVKKVEVVKKVIAEPVVNSNDNLLEDYLARSSNVVRKNVSSDNLSSDQLNKLLVLEKSGKMRSAVIRSIKNEMSR